MTPTRHRVKLIAETCALPCVTQLLGACKEQDLLAWLEAELGDARALDEFLPHGPLQSRAIAPRTILHIVSGNTPHAAMQSALRGMLLGSHNIVKIPSAGLPGFTTCVSAFPPELQRMLEIHHTLTDDHWHAADAVVATGSDATMAAVQKKITPAQTFIPHGHKVSIGIVYDDFHTAAARAARDICLHDQQGCLSPHAIYVHGDAPGFAALLAGEMQTYTRKHPPSPVDLSSTGAIGNLRETTRFLAANNPAVRLWESDGTPDWTVICEPSPTLKLSCLHRCVYVKPLPAQPDTATLGRESRFLSTIAIHPYSCAAAKKLTHLPAHRICPMGDAQHPSLFWHHDGFAPLASLVKWQDLG